MFFSGLILTWMKITLHKKITKTFVVFCLLLNLFAKWQSRSVKLSRLAKNTRHAQWSEILFEVTFLFPTSLASVFARYFSHLITFIVHKVHSFLKQCCAWFSVDSKQCTAANVSWERFRESTLFWINWR